MVNKGEDFHSLSTFKGRHAELMKRMKKTGRPLVLTVYGKAEAVVLDPAVYRMFADQLDAVREFGVVWPKR